MFSENNIHYATQLIGTGKADNAGQVAKALQEATNKTFSVQTLRNHLKDTGMKAVVKKKRPLLLKRHRKARMDFALAHKDWTIEDWKKVVWSDETKINRLGSDGRQWVWKKTGESLSDSSRRNSEVWRRIINDVGVHDVRGGWICMQD